MSASKKSRVVERKTMTIADVMSEVTPPGGYVPCTLRFPPELYERLKAESKRRKISLNALVMLCVDQFK